ncbi:hybrid sensor histidine kinase/response regulator [Methyloversatilis universalis]|uniref:hybrid sensor histidine kinase/response regulator n=1 Tax=Methyloversatilis universalis TaxID=378211 RepID=UPI00035E5875|nr:ATP-binding protein [Methyloversatilis universalis]
MKAAIETDILFRIALVIGEDAHLEQMTRRVLSEMQRLLDARRCAVYARSGERLQCICAVPDRLEPDAAFEALQAGWPDAAGLAGEGWRMLGDPALTHHLIDLPDYGLLLIERSGEPLDPGFLDNFRTLARKLAIACRACVNEEELERQKHRLELATSAASIGIWAWNRVSGALTWDDQMCRLHGLAPAQCGGGLEGWLHRLLPAEADAFAQALDRAAREDTRLEQDVRVNLTDGSHRVLRILGGVRGHPDEVAGVAVDVTASREAKEALRRARDAAEAASRAKSEFLANMSHEIRTPMNGVLGMLDLALDAADEAERRECVATARSSAESLLVIINDILDFSKIEAGKVEVEAVSFDLGEQLSQVVRTLAAPAARKSLALELQVAPGVPPRLTGDPLRLRQVLLNLVSNAIKFTHEGGVTLRVERADAAGGERLLLSVIDTGIGIPADKQAHVFEAFAQQDSSTTRGYGGTGLGLSIASRLTGLMGGGISLDSAPDCGSTFRVDLPLLRADAGPALPAEGQAGETGAGKGLSVLLVEDHPVNQKVATVVLERAGHRVCVVHNGIEAIEKVAEGGFDLVLMDMQMPVMGGVEAARLIRQMEQELGRLPVPIFAMTANAQEEDRTACLDAGMNDFLTKPLLPRVLREKIAALATGQPDTDDSSE